MGRAINIYDAFSKIRISSSCDAQELEDAHKLALHVKYLHGCTGTAATFPKPIHGL